MCGIAGFINLTPNQNKRSPEENFSILKQMNETLRHRGPDDDGFLQDSPLFMAMRRLKIIDLSTGKQPISNEDGTVQVVFNGEIYNYIELRTQLQQKGHKFKTQSDTEVLVHLYEEEGELFVRKLRGMFAFAIWDSKKKRLLLGRDHFGIKPLYWGIFNGELLFGSEIKSFFPHPSFSREINREALDDFLTLLFIPTPHTAYENVFKLEPGTVLVVEPGHDPKRQIYWDPIQIALSAQSSQMNNLNEIEGKLEQQLAECVNLVLRSDVPLGVFLSSGLDSTTIAYFAQKKNPKLKTFTIYYEDESYSERVEAAAVAKQLGTDHTEIPMELPKNLPEFVWNVLSHFDQPFGDLSVLPTYLLCQAARPYITVALSGDGGDELLGGYPTTTASQIFSLYRHLPSALRDSVFPQLVNLLPTDLGRVSFDYKLKRLIQSSIGLTNTLQSHFAWRGAFTWGERGQIYTPEYFETRRRVLPYENAIESLKGMERLSVADQSMLADLKVNLVDQYLIKADMTSMAHSLELRPAFLDPEFAELTFHIPHKFKIRGFKTKWILRKLMRGKLPDQVIDLPKKGFTPPLSFWLTEDRFQNFIKEVTSTDSFRHLGIFKEGVIEKLLSDHKQRKVDNTRRLWAILSLASFVK